MESTRPTRVYDVITVLPRMPQATPSTAVSSQYTRRKIVQYLPKIRRSSTFYTINAHTLTCTNDFPTHLFSFTHKKELRYWLKFSNTRVPKFENRTYLNEDEQDDGYILIPNLYKLVINAGIYSSAYISGMAL